MLNFEKLRGISRRARQEKRLEQGGARRAGPGDHQSSRRRGSEGETEADQIGIELAARAGYDPRAAVTLWQKMAKEGGGTVEFLSTHPSPENRAQRLNELIAKVDPIYDNDLTYFLLAEAAKGLGSKDAAAAYYKRASEATAAGRTCGGSFNTCDGFVVGEVKPPG